MNVGNDIVGSAFAVCFPKVTVKHQAVLGNVSVVCGCHKIANSFFVYRLVNAKLEHKTDRQFLLYLERDILRGFEVFAVESYVILNNRYQGCGNLPGNSLAAVGNAGFNLHEHKQQVAFGGFAAVAVGANDISRIGGSGGYTLCPSAAIASVLGCVPADIVAVIVFVYVCELTVVIRVVEQISCGFDVNADACAHRLDNLIAELGGVFDRTQAGLVVFKIGCKLRAVIEHVVHKNTLYVGNLHIFADIVGKGNVTAGVCVGAFDIGRIILGLKIYIVDNAFEVFDKLVNAARKVICVNVILVCKAIGVIGFYSGLVPIKIAVAVGLIGGGNVNRHIPAVCIFINLPEAFGHTERIEYAQRVLGIADSGTAEREEKHISVVLFFDFTANVRSGKLGKEGYAVDLTAYILTVGNVTCTYVIVFAGCGGRMSVAHKYHNGNTLFALLKTAFDNRAFDRIECLVRLVKSVLNIGCAAVIMTDVDRHIFACAVIYLVGCADSYNVVENIVRIARVGGFTHQKVAAVVICVIAVNRKHYGSRIGTRRTDTPIARIKHYAHAVFGIERQKRFYRGVCRGDKLVEAGSHRKRNVENKNRIGRQIIVTGDGFICRQSRKSYENVALLIELYGIFRKRARIGKYRFIEPDGACVFGACVIYPEVVLPAIHSRAVGGKFYRIALRHGAGKGNCKDD